MKSATINPQKNNNLSAHPHSRGCVFFITSLQYLTRPPPCVVSATTRVHAVNTSRATWRISRCNSNILYTSHKRHHLRSLHPNKKDGLISQTALIILFKLYFRQIELIGFGKITTPDVASVYITFLVGIYHAPPGASHTSILPRLRRSGIVVAPTSISFCLGIVVDRNMRELVVAGCDSNSFKLFLAAGIEEGGELCTILERICCY